MKYIRLDALALAFAVFFIACSDDGYLDKAVQGLKYSCSSGKTGVTDAYGNYECKDGDDVTFFVDSVEIKTIKAKKGTSITPHELFPDNDMDANDLVKLLNLSDKNTQIDNSIVKDNKTPIEITTQTTTKHSSISKVSTKKNNIDDTKIDSKDNEKKEVVVDDTYPTFIYRAWGMGGDATYSKAVVVLESKTYTILAFSQKNIKQLDASTAGDVTTIIANVEKDGVVKQIQLTLSQDYLGSQIVLKAYNSLNTFDQYSLRGFSSQNMLADSGTYIDIGTFNVE